MFLFIVELVASSHLIYSDKNQITIHSCLFQNIFVEISSRVIEIESNFFSNTTAQIIKFNEFRILEVFLAFCSGSWLIKKLFFRFLLR
jgi:hypothetical protein